MSKNITEAAYMEFWQEIKRRVEGLKSRDTELTVFGAKHHKYLMKPCLSEDEIAKFEEENAFQLPEDYRTYLKFFGNGGVGPHYGVIPLKLAACESFPLDVPFKFTLPYFPDVEVEQFFEFDHTTRTTEYFFTSREALIEAIYGTEEAYQKATNYVDEATLDAYSDEQYKEYQAFTKYGGILWLCEEGCGHISFLVVRGQEYGAIWGDSTVSDYGIFPHTKKGDKSFKTRLSFAEWFSEWLEKCESELGLR
ncbi:MAG: SMI1/KNR4 family protein [Candidatus Kapaibacterium sp.]|nr:MAG: SMI1/KNR4 family protein [Candidatus Kapabacteria bacterium]